MKQLAQVKFQSEDKKIELLCDTDTALGKIHDFLMALKGEIVDRMVKAQKEETGVAEEKKKSVEVDEGKPTTDEVKEKK